MRAKILLSLCLLLVAIVFMFVAVRYFFIYLETGDYAGSVMFYIGAGIGIFALALNMK